eukprot:TRINITY_DN15946_c0_g2_i1.p1 TRINITY_DN15946_c0_g2~~TRINITY_DN15946_c0_g2_i1.p1  ORF type:complete len:409 (+),score=123.27 TRINITY_DN15946_c0_g2_i1:170-1396(+)
MADLLDVLRQLAQGGSPGDLQGEASDEEDDEGEEDEERGSSSGGRLSVGERLQSCVVAFRIVRSNLDALNVDLRAFYVQLYVLLLEAPVDFESEGVLAEALQVMLWEGRHTDLQRCAAFIKRLAAAALHWDAGRGMAALVVIRQLLQRHAKCRNLLENEPGGGAAAGFVGSDGSFRPEESNPEASGSLSSVLWELPLLATHYQPALSSLASLIANLVDSNPSSAPAHLQSSMTPVAALVAYSNSQGTFRPAVPQPSRKKGRGGDGAGRRGNGPLPSVAMTPNFLSLLEGAYGVGVQNGSDMLGQMSRNGHENGVEHLLDSKVVGRIERQEGDEEGSREFDELFREYFREVRAFADNKRLRKELRRTKRLSLLMETELSKRRKKPEEKGKGKRKDKVGGKGLKGLRRVK